MKKYFINKKNMSYDDWITARRKGIGGSDVAAILGISKYKTPLDIYHEKTSQHQVCVENIYTEAGKRLENAICKWYADKKKLKIKKDNKIRMHRKYNFMFANIDRIILSDDHNFSNEILEAKNISYHSFVNNWQDGPLPEYICQVQHYMNVIGFNKAVIVALIGGYDLRDYEIKRDDELINLINEKLIFFWQNNVLKKIPPDPINENDIMNLYSQTKKNSIIKATETNYENYIELKKKIKERKKINEDIENLKKGLQLALLDNEIMQYEGVNIITWKEQKKKKDRDIQRIRKFLVK